MDKEIQQHIMRMTERVSYIRGALVGIGEDYWAPELLQMLQSLHRSSLILDLIENPDAISKEGTDSLYVAKPWPHGIIFFADPSMWEKGWVRLQKENPHVDADFKAKLIEESISKSLAQWNIPYERAFGTWSTHS